MDNIFKKGDKYIHFKEDGTYVIKTIKNIALSQVSEISGFCYEVINLIPEEDYEQVSLGQTKGRIHKLNHVMTEEEIELFKKNLYKDSIPTRYE